MQMKNLLKGIVIVLLIMTLGFITSCPGPNNPSGPGDPYDPANATEVPGATLAAKLAWLNANVQSNTAYLTVAFEQCLAPINN